MKMAKKLIYGLLFGVILFSMITSLELHNNKNKSGHGNSQIIRPNIADLNNQMKSIKPYIEKPFLPQEVERLSEPKKKIFEENSMTNAILLGPTQSKGGLDENPSMYSTVIDRHSTSVVHPVPQPRNYQVHPGAAKVFGLTNSEILSEAEKMTPGAYSIPVKIGGTASNDPTLSGYETPNFIHKGEKQIPLHNIHPVNVNPELDMKNTIQNDIQNFVSQFDNAHDKDERTKICKKYNNIIKIIVIEGKARLAAEAKSLTDEIENELKELLFAKEVAIKMQNVIANFEVRMRKDQLSKLKLADEVTIKNLLRDKLQREMQGFRTSPGEFKELEMVNPADIAQIIHNIKLKIGQ